MARTSTESRFSRVMKELVRGSTVSEICCSSHSMGTFAALKICVEHLQRSGDARSTLKQLALADLLADGVRRDLPSAMVGKKHRASDHVFRHMLPLWIASAHPHPLQGSV